MARSVFSSHPPLLGSSSSGGVVTGTGFHHLGPLGFYLLAPFVAVLRRRRRRSRIRGDQRSRGGASRRSRCVVASASVPAGSSWSATALLALHDGLGAAGRSRGTRTCRCCRCGARSCCAWAVLSGGDRLGRGGSVLRLADAADASVVRAGGRHRRTGPAGRAPPGGARTPTAGGRRSRWWRRWVPLLAALGAGLVANLVVLVQQFFGAGPGQPDQRARPAAPARSCPSDCDAGAGTVAQAFDPTNWLPGSWFPQVIRPAELASPWLVVAVFVVLVVLEVLAVRRRSARAVPALSWCWCWWWCRCGSRPVWGSGSSACR